jgi:hypothetical protein
MATMSMCIKVGIIYPGFFLFQVNVVDKLNGLITQLPIVAPFF